MHFCCFWGFFIDWREPSAFLRESEQYFLGIS
jgi:hypothetical protein